MAEIADFAMHTFGPVGSNPRETDYGGQFAL